MRFIALSIIFALTGTTAFAQNADDCDTDCDGKVLTDQEVVRHEVDILIEDQGALNVRLGELGIALNALDARKCTETDAVARFACKGDLARSKKWTENQISEINVKIADNVEAIQANAKASAQNAADIGNLNGRVSVIFKKTAENTKRLDGYEDRFDLQGDFNEGIAHVVFNRKFGVIASVGTEYLAVPEQIALGLGYKPGTTTVGSMGLTYRTNAMQGTLGVYASRGARSYGYGVELSAMWNVNAWSGKVISRTDIGVRLCAGNEHFGVQWRGKQSHESVMTGGCVLGTLRLTAVDEDTGTFAVEMYGGAAGADFQFWDNHGFVVTGKVGFRFVGSLSIKD